MQQHDARQQLREYAKGCLRDAVISYLALVEETPGDHSSIALDEWSAACHDAGQDSRDALELRRLGNDTSIIALLSMLNTPLRECSDEPDEHLEAEVEERRQRIRALRAGREPSDFSG